MASQFNHEFAYRDLSKFQDKLITIMGVGALGSNLAESLARMGFKRLRVIDFDRVEEHNCSIQAYGKDQVGMLKVEALKAKLFRQVGVEIETVKTKFEMQSTAFTSAKSLKDVHLVIDCFDNRKARTDVVLACSLLKLRCLHVGLSADFAEVIWNERYTVPRDVGTDVCDYPLTRNVVMLAVTVAAEEIVRHFMDKQHKNWTITLNDFGIKEF